MDVFAQPKSHDWFQSVKTSLSACVCTCGCVCVCVYVRPGEVLKASAKMRNTKLKPKNKKRELEMTRQQHAILWLVSRKQNLLTFNKSRFEHARTALPRSRARTLARALVSARELICVCVCARLCVCVQCGVCVCVCVCLSLRLHLSIKLSFFPYNQAKNRHR